MIWRAPGGEPRRVALSAAVMRGQEDITIERWIRHDQFESWRFEIAGQQDSLARELDRQEHAVRVVAPEHALARRMENSHHDISVIGSQAVVQPHLAQRD